MEKMVQLLQTLKEELPSLDFGALPKQTPTLLKYLKYYNFVTSDNCCYMGYFSVKKHRLAAHIFLPAMPPKGTIFYLHGYTDHVTSASRLIQYFTQQNFAVATYDMIGHGLSDGMRGYIDDFNEYLQVLEAFIQICRLHLPKPYHLVGHSLGGAIAKEYVVKHSNSGMFDKVILLAPLIRLYGWFFLNLKYKVMSRLVKEVRREFKNSSHDEELLRFAKEADPLQLQTIPLKWVQAYSSWYQQVHSYGSNSYPIKIIQGNQDQTVDWKYNCQFIQQKFPLSSIMIIPGARHALFGEGESYWQQTVVELSKTLDEICELSK